LAATAPQTGEDRPLIGIGLMLVAYLLFSCIDTGSKWLALAAIPALQLSFMRYIGHFCISLGLVGRGGWSLSRFACDKPLLVVARGTLLMFSTVFNFFALRYLPLSLTGTILFSAPIIVCALSWPLLRERVGIYRWFAIALGFAGIVIAIRPFSEDFHWAVFLSLGGAVSFALYSILTRRLSGVVATDIMQFYSGLVGTAVLLPFAVLEWQSPAGAFNWLVMISLGLFGWAGHQLLTRAVGIAPPNLLMPFGYSFILYLTIWSTLVFHDVPDRWTLLGAAIIIVAGLVIWFRERQLYRRRRYENLL
jgi:drug/metabolite transporter (DMT)-like permease